MRRRGPEELMCMPGGRGHPRSLLTEPERGSVCVNTQIYVLAGERRQIMCSQYIGKPIGLLPQAVPSSHS